MYIQFASPPFPYPQITAMDKEIGIYCLSFKQKTLPLQPSSTLKPAEGGREVADIDGKASLVRFVLDSQ